MDTNVVVVLSFILTAVILFVFFRLIVFYFRKCQVNRISVLNFNKCALSLASVALMMFGWEFFRRLQMPLSILGGVWFLVGIGLSIYLINDSHIQSGSLFFAILHYVVQAYIALFCLATLGLGLLVIVFIAKGLSYDDD